MRFINSAENIMKFINRRLSELCGILLFIIIILLLANVISREIGYGIEGLSNLSVIVLVSVIYLGLSTTEQKKQHASVEILEYRLNKKQKRVVDIVIHIIKLGTIVVFLYAAFGNTMFSIKSNELFADVVNIPMWPSKTALLIGIIFFTIQILLNLLRIIIDPDYSENEKYDIEDDLTANL